MKTKTGKPKKTPLDTTSSILREEPHGAVLEVGAFEAKTHLSALLGKVAQGETIHITKHGKPVAKLSPIEAPKKTRTLGDWAGRKYWMAPDFDAPLEDFKEYME